MFEAAELGRTIPKDEYKARVPALRDGAARGPAAADRGAIPGHRRVCRRRRRRQGRNRQPAERVDGFPLDRDARLRRPVRRRARAAGVLALLARPAAEGPHRPVPELVVLASRARSRLRSQLRSAEFDEQLDRIVEFERTLTDDGALILKFWMHLGKSAQKKRLGRSRRIR